MFDNKIKKNNQYPTLKQPNIAEKKDNTTGKFQNAPENGGDGKACVWKNHAARWPICGQQKATILI